MSEEQSFDDIIEEHFKNMNRAVYSGIIGFGLLGCTVMYLRTTDGYKENELAREMKQTENTDMNKITIDSVYKVKMDSLINEYQIKKEELK